MRQAGMSNFEKQKPAPGGSLRLAQVDVGSPRRKNQRSSPVDKRAHIPIGDTFVII
jgi:hypothetical protein